MTSGKVILSPGTASMVRRIVSNAFWFPAQLRLATPFATSQFNIIRIRPSTSWREYFRITEAFSLFTRLE